MDTTDRQLNEVMMAMEVELRSLTLWEAVPPPPTDLRSMEPFCCDTLSFPQWLLWVLLPRMHDVIEQGGPYRARSFSLNAMATKKGPGPWTEPIKPGTISPSSRNC